MPLDIIHLTTIFVDDHFMITRGGYQWYIDGELLNKMKTAASKQRFYSDTFRIAELDWMLFMFPNGYEDDDACNCTIFLTLLSLPLKWSDLTLYYSICCAETQSSHGHQFRVSDSPYFNVGWPINTMLLDEIQSLNKLSFTTSIIINEIKLSEPEDKMYYQRDVSIPKNTTLEMDNTITIIIQNEIKSCWKKICIIDL